MFCQFSNIESLVEFGLSNHLKWNSSKLTRSSELQKPLNTIRLLIAVRDYLFLFPVGDDDSDIQRYPRILFDLIESDVIC